MVPRAMASMALVLGVVAASVASAEICYSPSQAVFTALPDQNTLFNCPSNAQSRTISQLAASGFEIVKLRPLVAGDGNLKYQLLLRRSRSALVFANGFEP